MSWDSRLGGGGGTVPSSSAFRHGETDQWHPGAGPSLGGMEGSTQVGGRLGEFSAAGPTYSPSEMWGAAGRPAVPPTPTNLERVRHSYPLTPEQPHGDNAFSTRVAPDAAEGRAVSEGVSPPHRHVVKSTPLSNRKALDVQGLIRQIDDNARVIADYKATIRKANTGLEDYAFKLQREVHNNSLLRRELDQERIRYDKERQRYEQDLQSQAELQKERYDEAVSKEKELADRANIENQKLQEEHTMLLRQLEEMEGLKAYRDRYSDLEAEVCTLQQNLDEISHERDGLAERSRKWEIEANNLRRSIDNDRKAVDEEVHRLSAELVGARGELLEQEERHASERREVEAKNHDLVVEMENMRDEVRRMETLQKDASTEAQDTRRTLETKVRSLQQDLEELRRERDQLAEREERHASERREVENKNEALTLQLEKVHSELRRLQSLKKDVEAEAKGAAADAEAARAEASRATQEAETAVSRLREELNERQAEDVRAATENQRRLAAQLEASRVELSRLREESKKSLAALREESNVRQRAALEGLEMELKQKAEAEAESAAAAFAASASAAAAAARKAASEERARALDHQRDELEARHARAMEALRADLMEQLGARNTDVEALEAEIQELGRELQESDAALETASSGCSRLQNELMRVSKVAYSDGVRRQEMERTHDRNMTVSDL